MSLEQYTGPVVAWVAANQGWAVPIVFLLAFAESLAFVSLLLPSTAILLGISALFGAGGIAFLPLWTAATVGSILGYWISYHLGYVYRDTITSMWPLSKYPEQVARGKAIFDTWGAYGVFAGHLMGPVRAVIPVVAGMYAMRAVPFQIANVTSAALWSAIVLSPNLLAAYWQPIKAWLAPYVWGPVGRIIGIN